MTLTFDDALNEISTPAGSAFSISAAVGGRHITRTVAAMDGVSVSGSTVVLTLAKPLSHLGTAW